MASIMFIQNLLAKIENETGYHAYETSNQNQLVFYGTSAKLGDFKELASNYFETGTIVMVIDTGETSIYSKYDNAWY